MQLFCLQETWLHTRKDTARNLCWGRFDNTLTPTHLFQSRAPGQVQLYLSLYLIPFRFCIIIQWLLHIRVCLHRMIYSLKCLKIWDLSSNLPTESVQSVSSSWAQMSWWGQIVIQKLFTILKSRNYLYASSLDQQRWVSFSVTQWVSTDHSMRKSRCTPQFHCFLKIFFFL